MMTKQEAISLFGGQKNLADAIGSSTQAVSQWPEDLTQRIEDRVVGAALRNGIDVSALNPAGGHNAAA